MARLLLDTVSQKNVTSKSHGAYTNEANFDTNMVIILAALLCALICALGLNSIVRCALRCGRRMTVDETAVRLAGSGLKKRALRRIPVVVYGSPAEAGGNIPAATDCPICLGEFVGGEKLKVLPKCKHGFHARCIDTWLGSHSSCPTCRNSVLEKPVAATPPDITGASGGGDGGSTLAIVDDGS
ncbi:hypothetical protein Sjap_014329 [Stephania japonica]|uniref:RING-type domain-containing protein n=1 Tax=Stephania japonica TaxID=461633 RepID=A0AAP0J1P7_9MAGN